MFFFQNLLQKIPTKEIPSSRNGYKPGPGGTGGNRGIGKRLDTEKIQRGNERQKSVGLVIFEDVGTVTSLVMFGRHLFGKVAHLGKKTYVNHVDTH